MNFTARPSATVSETTYVGYKRSIFRPKLFLLKIFLESIFITRWRKTSQLCWRWKKVYLDQNYFYKTFFLKYFYYTMAKNISTLLKMAVMNAGFNVMQKKCNPRWARNKLAKNNKFTELKWNFMTKILLENGHFI